MVRSADAHSPHELELARSHQPPEGWLEREDVFNTRNTEVEEYFSRRKRC